MAQIADADDQGTKVTFWTRLRRHKLAIVSIVVLVLIILAAVLAKFLGLPDPNAIDQKYWLGDPVPPCFVNAALCGGHFLGTDEVGRDLLSRLFYGAQVSLQVGLFAVIMELVIGTVIGAIAGYYGGWVDYLLMRLTDVFHRDRGRDLEQGQSRLRDDRPDHRRAHLAVGRATGARLIFKPARTGVHRSRARGRQ